jgi:hypothetical protein
VGRAYVSCLHLVDNFSSVLEIKTGNNRFRKLFSPEVILLSLSSNFSCL